MSLFVVELLVRTVCCHVSRNDDGVDDEAACDHDEDRALFGFVVDKLALDFLVLMLSYDKERRLYCGGDGVDSSSSVS